MGRHYVHAAHPGNLLQKLGACRNPGFFDAVEIAVDAGVDRAERNGKGKHPQHGSRAGFLEQTCGNGVREAEQDGITGQGQGQ